MISIPASKPTKAQILTTAAGLAVMALGYYFPALLPALAAAGKLLWASGLFTAGSGAVQIVSKGDS